MFSKKHVAERVTVPPAMDAAEAARIAFERDKGRSRHHFVDGEHPVVRIEHLNKTFTDTPVLRDVNLNVWNGEIVVVLGPSGSGKSTMLRCINLLETPTAGHILIDDEEITGTSKANVNELRRNLGMVFQGFNLFPHLSALENVMIGQTKVLRRGKDEAREEALKQLDAVGLADRADYKPPQLSGGQQQRVGIARALADEPAVLLCDEPTSALDPETTRSILDLIRDVRDRLGVTVVIITHEMSVVRRICDSVSLLEAGRIVQSGPIEDVVSDVGSRLSRELVPPPDVPGAVRAGGAESAGAVNVVIDVALTAHPGEPAAAQVLALVAEQGADVAGGVFETLGTAQVGRLALTIPADRARAAVEALHDAGITAEVRA